MTFRRPTQHPHDDSPDTDDAFRRLQSLPPGQAREQLIGEIATAWLPMAHRLAQRYRSSGEPVEDLRQVAALGLIKAVRRYDPAVSPAFATYAVPTIDGELRRHLRDFTELVHLPRHLQQVRDQVRAALQYQGLNAADPLAPRAVAAATGLSQGDIAEGLGAVLNRTTLSLDAATPNAPTWSLLEVLGQADERLDTVEARVAVRPLLRALPERERMILYLRFFEERTQADIAARFGLSQVHVSRLIRSVCQSIRQRADARAPAPAPTAPSSSPPPGTARAGASAPASAAAAG